MENNAFTVRLARQDDAWELARLLSLFDSQMIAQSQFFARLKTIQNIETPLLAEAAGRIIGLACLRVVPCLSADAPHAEITELWVEKAYLGNDVERVLIEKMEHLAIERGALHLILHTGQKNTEAQSLYRELGFRDFALAMRKTLAGRLKAEV